MSVTVAPDPGPVSAPTARPGVGFDGASCDRYAWSPTPDGSTREGSTRTRIAAIDHRIESGDALEYVVLPAYDEHDTDEDQGRRGLASTGMIVDLLFDDGARLSATELHDHHGVRFLPEAMRASLSLLPDQWNRVEVDLSALAGRIVRAAEIVVAPSSRAFRGWVDGIGIVRADRAAASPLDEIVTLRGSHSSRALSRGNTVPLVGMPNAFHALTPVTNARDAAWPYTFQLDVDDQGRPGLEAFAVTHTASPWLGDRGVLHWWPVDARATRAHDPARRRQPFLRSDEDATPWQYAVRLADGTTVRMAPTQHAAIAEIRFPHDRPAVVLDLPDGPGAFERHGERVIGWTEQAGALADHSPRCWYAIAFDGPVVAFEPIGGRGSRAHLVVLDGADRERVTMSIGSSFIDRERASAQLNRELASKNLDAVAAGARQAWSACIERFSVTGGTGDQRTSFFSSLYRIFLYPSSAHEPADDGSPVHRRVDGRAGVAAGPLTVNHGFWDTYRTVWPAYALFDPDRAAALLDGVVQHARDSGWLPRWCAPGAVDIMVGTSADVILAEAVVKDVPLADPLTAFDAVIIDATVPSSDPALGRTGLRSARYLGYTSTAVAEGLSWTLENAVSDAAIAEFAARMAAMLPLAHPRLRELADLQEYLTHRSQSYALLFDVETGLFRGRDEHGELSGGPFDPDDWGGDYTETNAWGMAVSVPHDPYGLAHLLGGRGALRDRLDALFARPELATDRTVGAYGERIHEMLEARNMRMGMVALSNQPAHHVPFLYAYTDAPHRTQHLTRTALRRCFLGSELGQGYPGDDDNGEMSAWFVFAAMGLYPLAPWSAEYVLTAPLFERVDVRLDRGTLTIAAGPIAPGFDYVQSVRVDGEPWDSPRIPHARIANGAVIDIELGPAPSDWGAATGTEDEQHLRLRTDASRAARLAAHPRFASLVDDRAEVDVSVAAGDALSWRHDRPVSVAQLTLTCGMDPRRAPVAWRFEGSDDGERWHLLETREDERFRWPEQLRPFSPGNRGPHLHHRLRFDAPGTLRQVELLADAPCPCSQRMPA